MTEGVDVTGWTPATFDGMWRRAVIDGPDRVFLRFESRGGDTTEWTYGEFDRVVEGAAVRLEATGIGPGGAVHLALTNSPAFVAAWLGAIRLGAWIVPSDPMSTTAELTEHISRTTPLVGFCAMERADTYRAVPGDTPPPTVIEVDESDAALRWLTPVAPAERRRPSIRDRAAVMFTSGTTGRPKGVEITQANYAFAGTAMAAASDLTAADRQLVVLPLFHANAQYYSFASAIAVGASVAMVPAFSASRFVEQAADHAATCASLFAGPIRMILARGSARPPSAPPLRLRHCWFAQNLTPAQHETISEWLGCRPRQLYGMTETIAAVLTDRRDEPRCDTMGFVTEGCIVDLRAEGEIVGNAEGEIVGHAEGEIVIGGERGVTLFAGYLDDPETTAASFRDGWFLTGDRATRDESGRFRFAGRRSDVLKVAGENVSTVEVEQVLATHPQVADVAVVGMPDDIRDEVPLAYIVPAPDTSADSGLRGSLEAWCAERLGKAKRPAAYRFVDELPRTSVGKIKKYQLMRSPAQHESAGQARTGRSTTAFGHAGGTGAPSPAPDDAAPKRKAVD